MAAHCLLAISPFSIPGDDLYHLDINTDLTYNESSIESVAVIFSMALIDDTNKEVPFSKSR
jgi:hypothetical protein